MILKKRRTETSDSFVSNTTPQLPMDLIIYILSRLPVKSLLRFKSVSKPWDNLINSPHFIQKHVQLSKLNPHPIFSSLLSALPLQNKNKFVFRLNLIDALDKPIDIEFPFMSNYKFHVLGIRDGLVCVMLCDKSSDIIVCNPARGKYRKIPPFDNSRRPNSCIFYGFSSNANGYELIRIDYKSNRIKANSYSLGTNTWRDIKVKMKMGKFDTYSGPTAFMGQSRCTGPIPVLRNGGFYWKGHYIEIGRVLALNVCSEVFDEMWAPGDTCKNAWGLRELKEEPVVVVYNGLGVINLWMLSENEKSWTMKHKINVGDRITVFSYYRHVTVLRSTSNGELVLKGMLVLKDFYETPQKLVAYYVDTGDASILPYVNVGWILDTYLYTESLVSVNPSDNVA